MDDLEKIHDVDYNPTTEEIFSHLKFISNLLTKNSIKHWLNYGTLLGALRQKDIIPYDYDFDLGVLIEDTEKILELNNEIEKDLYKFELTKGTLFKRNNNKLREYLWRVSIKVLYNDLAVGDLYIYCKCPDGFMRRFDPKDKIYFWPKSTFPFFMIENLGTLEIRDLEFPVPKFPEILIEYFYGPMWKIPIRSLSQNGENHEDYDFYGSYKYSSLEIFFDFVERKNKENECDLNIPKELKPKFGFENFEWVFPLDQIDWVKDNEI